MSDTGTVDSRSTNGHRLTPGAPGSVPPTESRSQVWIRRMVIVAVLAGAVGILAWGATKSDSGSSTDRDPVIVAQFPAPGARAPRQSEIGASLQPGFDGRLTINGIAIPESQMTGVLPDTSPEADDYAGTALRPNNRHHVSFVPGPGKVIERLESGLVTVTVRYFPDLQPDRPGRTITWTFTAF